MINNELLTIFTHASIHKFLRSAGIGVPLRFMQMGDEKDGQVQDEVQILINIDFPDRGGANETYALVWVKAFVKTKILPSDVFYHTRVKARVADVLNRVIPLLKIGGPDPLVYTKAQVGILRRLPSETLTINAVGNDTPDASLVETCYEVQLC